MTEGAWVTDLKVIENLAGRNEEDNQKFGTFLKTQDDPKKIDTLVKFISQNVAAGIDCKKCANCCKSLTVAVNHPDMEKLATALDHSTNVFKTQFMNRDLQGQSVFKRRPWSFLKSNLCSVYENRPSTCRTYPHLETGNFIPRLGNVLSNLKVCPIAYNTFELLKLNFE